MNFVDYIQSIGFKPYRLLVERNSNGKIQRRFVPCKFDNTYSSLGHLCFVFLEGNHEERIVESFYKREIFWGLMEHRKPPTLSSPEIANSQNEIDKLLKSESCERIFERCIKIWKQRNENNPILHQL